MGQEGASRGWKAHRPHLFPKLEDTLPNFSPGSAQKRHLPHSSSHTATCATDFPSFQSKKLRHTAWQGRRKIPDLNVPKPPQSPGTPLMSSTQLISNEAQAAALTLTSGSRTAVAHLPEEQHPWPRKTRRTSKGLGSRKDEMGLNLSERTHTQKCAWKASVCIVGCRNLPYTWCYGLGRCRSHQVITWSQIHPAYG